MEKKILKDVIIPSNDLVTVTKMNHIIEVQHMQKMNRNCYIKKLNKNEYVDLQTGEIREFTHIYNRKQSYKSLARTFKNLRYLINNNFTGKPNELFVTLTYPGANMTDTKRLYRDFDVFMKRLKRKYKDDTTIDYITVVEPHEKGGWHCHVLLRFNELKRIFIPSNELAEMWGQGIIKIERLNQVDNIGAYLSAYLANVEVTIENLIDAYEANSAPLYVQEKQGKEYIKGGRLHLYPPGTRIYRKSKGIVYPERKQMRYKHVKSIVGSVQPDYSTSSIISDGEFTNTISFESYNLKRKPGLEDETR